MNPTQLETLANLKRQHERERTASERRYARFYVCLAVVVVLALLLALI